VAQLSWRFPWTYRRCYLARVVSGDPLVIGVAMDSVRQWKFKPYNSRGTNKAFCGRVALRFQANERTVKYKIIYARAYMSVPDKSRNRTSAFWPKSTLPITAFIGS
jgi:hypothetical protein